MTSQVDDFETQSSHETSMVGAGLYKKKCSGTAAGVLENGGEDVPRQCFAAREPN
jgi:hypothetical protein